MKALVLLGVLVALAKVKGAAAQPQELPAGPSRAGYNER